MLALMMVLLAAGVLAAGLDGLRRSIIPPRVAPSQPSATAAVNANMHNHYVNETGPPLPRTLPASLAALEADQVMVDALGQTFVR